MYIIKISGDSYKIILSADDLKEYPEKLFNDADSSKQFFSDIMRTLDGNEPKNDTRSIAHAEFFENKSGGGELFLCLYSKNREKIYYILECDNWENNLALALQLREKLNSKYTSLCRPAYLRSSTYNQELAPYSLLLEVGACGNSLEEAKRAAALVATELSDIIKNG